jgi:hypothetical protein
MTTNNVAVIRGVVLSSLTSLCVERLLTMDCKKILDSVHVLATPVVIISVFVKCYGFSVCGRSGGGVDVSACGACLRKEPRMVLTAISMATMYIFYLYIRSINDA